MMKAPCEGPRKGFIHTVCGCCVIPIKVKVVVQAVPSYPGVVPLRTGAVLKQPIVMISLHIFSGQGSSIPFLDAQTFMKSFLCSTTVIYIGI